MQHHHHHSFPDDDHGLVETSKQIFIMLFIFGVSTFSYFIKILSRSVMSENTFEICTKAWSNWCISFALLQSEKDGFPNENQYVSNMMDFVLAVGYLPINFLGAELVHFANKISSTIKLFKPNVDLKKEKKEKSK